MPTSHPSKPMSKEEFYFLLWLIKLQSCEPMKIEEGATDETEILI